MSVFGALNRFISRLDDAPRPRSAGGDGSFGFQVLRNKNTEMPLEPWFDFIIGINGRQIENPDPNLFANEVRNCAGTSVALTLWNAKGQRVRETYFPIPTPSPTLGLTLQWTPLTSTTSSTWHILEVAPSSPADEAGLLPYGDYIIGTPEGILRGEGGLGELVDEYLARPLRLFVYNHEYDVTRTVTITPSRSWGGEGALGCVLGFGHLHVIPPPLEEGPPTGAGETMFESAGTGNKGARPVPLKLGDGGRKTPPHGVGANDDLSNFAMSPPKSDSGFQPANSAAPTLLTPVSMPAPPPMMSVGSGPLGPAKGGGAGGRQAKKTRPARNRGFDEIFAEGEKKSAEVDNAPKVKGVAVPPPPKGKSPGPGAALEVPVQEGLRPETRSPDPITGDSDEGSS